MNMQKQITPEVMRKAMSRFAVLYLALGLASTGAGEEIILNDLDINIRQGSISELVISSERVDQIHKAGLNEGIFAHCLSLDEVLARATKWLEGHETDSAYKCFNQLYAFEKESPDLFDPSPPFRLGDRKWDLEKIEVRLIDLGHKVFGERAYLHKPSGKSYFELTFAGTEAKFGTSEELKLYFLQDGSPIYPRIRKATESEMKELAERTREVENFKRESKKD